MNPIRLRVITILSVYVLTPIISSQVSFTPKTAILFPGGNVTFVCNNTNKFWLINDSDTRRTDNELAAIDGVTSTGPQLLTLVITQSANDTLYGCGVLMMGDFIMDTGVVYVATVPDQVPTLIIDAATLEDDMVNITLSWGEPFNNFDPIISYTVMCSGDDQCPPDITTMDNMTRSYTIINLTSMTTYTFSVVATNSIGNGEGIVLMITSPSLPGHITGVMLTCEAVDQINQCSVEWDPITVGNGPLDQPLVYEVYYNGTMENVTSPTTELTFTASSLPDGVFVDKIIVTVTAINRFGHGTPSDPEEFEIKASSVVYTTSMISNPDDMMDTYSVIVTCEIIPSSTAEFCEVIVRNDSAGVLARSSTGPVSNGMAVVTINGLECEVTYNIIAGGTLNGALVGPRSSYENISTGPCPEVSSSAISPTVTLSPNTCSCNDDCNDNTGMVVGILIGVVCAILIMILIANIIIWMCIFRKYVSKRSHDKIPMKPIPSYEMMNRDSPKEPTSHGDYENVVQPRPVSMTSNPAYTIP